MIERAIEALGKGDAKAALDSLPVEVWRARLGEKVEIRFDDEA
jgi:hypothetical protein